MFNKIIEKIMASKKKATTKKKALPSAEIDFQPLTKVVITISTDEGVNIYSAVVNSLKDKKTFLSGKGIMIVLEK